MITTITPNNDKKIPSVLSFDDNCDDNQDIIPAINECWSSKWFWGGCCCCCCWGCGDCRRLSWWPIVKLNGKEASPTNNRSSTWLYFFFFLSFYFLFFIFFFVWPLSQSPSFCEKSTSPAMIFIVHLWYISFAPTLLLWFAIISFYPTNHIYNTTKLLSLL